MNGVLPVPPKDKFPIEMTETSNFLDFNSYFLNIKAISSNEITNSAILKSIEEYEIKKSEPTPLNLHELIAVINA